MKKLLCILGSILLSSFVFAERPIVKNIQAIASSEDTILVTWENPKHSDQQITQLYLYKTQIQINSYNQLVNQEPVAKLDGNTSIYKDVVTDSFDYFYTVLTFTDKLNTQILISVNSTTKGVHSREKKDVQLIEESNENNIKNDEALESKKTGNRKTPLPFLDLVEGLEAESQISDESLAKTKTLATTPVTGIIEITYPHFFEEDLISSGNKDDYALFEILKTSFNEKKYKDSIPKFQKLSKKKINKDVLDRTLFYLGEAYYFTGDYENAVMCFIQVEKKYPLLTRKWISASLDKIKM